MHGQEIFQVFTDLIHFDLGLCTGYCVTCITKFCSKLIYICDFIVVFSDGSARTGAFCALVTSLERVKQDQSFNLFQTIMLQRIQRPKMVASVVCKSVSTTPYFLGHL